MFGLNCPQMGKKLHAMGVRDEKGAPSASALESGLARTKKVLIGYGVESATHQWNAKKFASLAADQGLMARSLEDQYVHAVSDKVSGGFRKILELVRKDGGTRQEMEPEEFWAPPSGYASMAKNVSELFIAHLDPLSPNSRAVFIDSLMEALLNKKVSKGFTRQLLASCEELHAFDARQHARTLESAWTTPGPQRKAVRL